MFSESASAQVNLVSTTGTQASPVYDYDITLTNTGTTNLGTFWFGWVPGQDFLPSVPSTVSDPSGWSHAITGSGDSADGSAIRWEASTGAITPGQSLGSFDFSTADSPTALAGSSPSHPAESVLTSFTYIGAPFADAGFQFVAAVGTTTVTPAASTTTLISTASTITAGNAVTLTATVASSTGSGATPTGTVTFFDNGSTLGTGTVQAGVATLTTSSLPTGSLSITAQYGGDNAYAASTSSPLTEVVNPTVAKVATTTALTTSAASVTSGTSVTFSATVTPATAGTAPTGTVDFTQSGTSVGSADVQSNGTASLTVTTLPVGSDPIIATYSGDSTYAGSASAAVTETIAAAPTLVASFIKSTAPASIVAGFAAHGAVMLHISNESSTTVKGAKSTVAIFASTTGSIDSASISLFSVTRPFTVGTVRPTPLTAPLRILATTLPAGSYTLIARVIDPAGNISDTIGPALTVAAPVISLSETVFRSTIPTAVTSGARASAAGVILSISNSGNIITPKTTTVAIFATTAGVVDSSAIKLASIARPLRIHPGAKPTRVTVPISHLTAISPGDYVVVAQVTDPDGQLSTVAVGDLTVT